MDFDKETAKAAFKEAAKEWLDDKYRQVGKWTVHGALAGLVFALGYFVLFAHGWRLS